MVFNQYPAINHYSMNTSTSRIVNQIVDGIKHSPPFWPFFVKEHKVRLL